MPAPFLAINYADGTTPQIRRYVTGVPATQGVTLGSLESAANAVTSCPHQRVMRFLGHSTWIVAMRDTIYRSTDAGASYTAVHTDANMGTTSAKAGPFLIYLNGTATLVIFAKQDAGSINWRMYTSTDGVTWSTLGPFALVNTADIAMQSVVLWRGAFYGVSGIPSNSLRSFTWNPGAGAAAVHTFPDSPIGGSNDAVMHDLCVFNDRLFCLYAGTASGTLFLDEFLGGTWVHVQSIESANWGLNGTNAKFGLFVDGTNMVGIAYHPNAGTWKVYRWDSALARTDITATINLASLLGSGNTQSRIRIMVDGEEPSFGSAPNIYIYHAANGTSGTTFTILQWNGVGTPPTSVGSGGNVQHAMPFGVQTGGSVFWTSGQRHIERITATPVLGGVRYGYKLFSPNPSVDTVSVRWNVGTAQDEYPHSPFATLSNPSVGTLAVADTQINGLDAADNGASTFLVTWLAQTDGFGVGSFAKTTPEVFS